MLSERPFVLDVFFSYAHSDKALRDKLEDHLTNLKYRGLISTWHDREISAGNEWAEQIDFHLNTAHIILLLISSNFMASEYCYGIEMKRAIERHERGEAQVIPILLRPVLFTGAPFAQLQMLPTNAKPVVNWRNRDSAFVDIARGIEHIVILSFSSHPNKEEVLESLERLSDEIRSPTFDQLKPLPAPYMPIQDVNEKAWRDAYYKETLTAYEQALLLNPHDPGALQGIGNALYSLERYDEALEAFKKAVLVDPKPSIYSSMGSTLCALSDFSQAAAAFELAFDLDPTVTLDYDRAYHAFSQLGRSQEADQIREKARQLGYED